MLENFDPTYNAKFKESDIANGNVNADGTINFNSGSGGGTEFLLVSASISGEVEDEPVILDKGYAAIKAAMPFVAIKLDVTSVGVTYYFHPCDEGPVASNPGDMRFTYVGYGLAGSQANVMIMALDLSEELDNEAILTPFVHT